MPDVPPSDSRKAREVDIRTQTLNAAAPFLLPNFAGGGLGCNLKTGKEPRRGYLQQAVVRNRAGER